MGIARSKDSTYELQQFTPSTPALFSSEGSKDRVRAAAIGEAIAWFLRRGYVPSIPVEPTRYDLVVESDSGLKRVQVKSTTAKNRYGNWRVGIKRFEYGLASTPGSNGLRGRTTYMPEEVDLFFIVTGDGARYLVPLEATRGAGELTLDRKYSGYLVTE